MGFHRLVRLLQAFRVSGFGFRVDVKLASASGYRWDSIPLRENAVGFARTGFFHAYKGIFVKNLQQQLPFLRLLYSKMIP